MFGTDNVLLIISVIFQILFHKGEQVAPIVKCPKGAERNTATCSHAGYVIPGYPTKETWTRHPDTPLVFYGRAVPYSPYMMWATATTRGFEREYLVQFDCLVSGFFINDVGRVAWLLHNGESYRCLVVDNARSRDIYNPVINSREAVEVSYNFYHDVLKGKTPDDKHPLVVMAYQIEEPTPKEWMSAGRLDEYLIGRWETSHHEPKGFIQIKPDQQAWYKISGDPLWTRIKGCLYCEDEFIYGFTGELDAYEVVYGDTLESISRKMYGYSHPRFWDAIYEANKENMPNPYFIRVGQILMIPVWQKIPEQDITNP